MAAQAGSKSAQQEIEQQPGRHKQCGGLCTSVLLPFLVETLLISALSMLSLLDSCAGRCALQMLDCV